MKHLLSYSLLFAFGIVFTFSAFNYIIDPIDLFKSPSIEGFNSVKPFVETHTRTWKAYKLDDKPDTLLLGTSRIMGGIDPENHNFSNHEVFNAGIPGGRPFEFQYYFEKALNNGSLKTLIIGLDEHAFYYKELTTPDFRESDFASGSANKYFYLLSLDMLKMSLRTIQDQKQQKKLFLSNGLENGEIPLNYVEIHGYRKKFLLSEEGYRYNEYSPAGRNQYETAHFKAFSNILMKAHQNDINVLLFISPCHARQWEVLNSTVGFDKLENWKRIIVNINEKIANDMHTKAFALWDFSGYDKLITEEVPAINDTKTKMKWWWDSNHYKKELGDIVLDRMMDTNYSGGQNYSDFGVKLTGENIESHLHALRIQRQEWRSSHPADIAEIEALKQ